MKQRYQRNTRRTSFYGWKIDSKCNLISAIVDWIILILYLFSISIHDHNGYYSVAFHYSDSHIIYILNYCLLTRIVKMANNDIIQYPDDVFKKIYKPA